MILTTTNTIEGHTIKDYLGIVTGVNASIPKATFSFNMKKYYESYENKVNEVKELAFQKLKSNAISLKANAVVGIKVDIESSHSSGMIMVSITRTAVKVL